MVWVIWRLQQWWYLPPGGFFDLPPHLFTSPPPLLHRPGADLSPPPAVPFYFLDLFLLGCLLLFPPPPLFFPFPLPLTVFSLLAPIFPSVLNFFMDNQSPHCHHCRCIYPQRPWYFPCIPWPHPIFPKPFLMQCNFTLPYQTSSSSWPRITVIPPRPLTLDCKNWTVYLWAWNWHVYGPHVGRDSPIFGILACLISDGTYNGSDGDDVIGLLEGKCYLSPPSPTNNTLFNLPKINTPLLPPPRFQLWREKSSWQC